MSRKPRARGWPLAVISAAALLGVGGIAYAAIPDSGGVIHTCYVKSSGAVRVIDTGLGQSCKGNELPLDVYSKNGADALFLDATEADALYLGKTAKAADTDKLDGQDSSAFLEATAKAADSEKLDGKDSAEFLGATATANDSDRLGGFPSRRWVFGGGVLFSDGFIISDGGVRTFDCCDPVDTTPSMDFELSCAASGGTTFVVSSTASFHWWWDDTSGDAAPVAGGYAAEFAIGGGTERHSLRALMLNGGTSTTLDLDTSIDSDCLVALTLFKGPVVTPGP